MQIKIRLLGVLCSVVALGSVAAACGGDEKLSVGDYYSKLETISQGVDTKIEEAQNKTPDSQEPDALKDFVLSSLDEQIKIIEDGTKELEGLTPPDETKTLHDAWIAAVKAQTTAIKEVNEQVKDVDPEGLDALFGTLDLENLSAPGEAACSALQADAATRNITIDLKCGDS